MDLAAEIAGAAVAVAADVTAGKRFPELEFGEAALMVRIIAAAPL